MRSRLARCAPIPALIGALMAAPVARGASPVPTACDGTWQIQVSPDASASNQLFDVSASSPTDAWAVGLAGNIFTEATLIEHYDGSAWSVVPAPTAGSVATLLGVATLSADDAWAVGYYAAHRFQSSLVEHWDGTSWTVVPSPNPGSGSNGLDAVDVVSPTDVWAVGSYWNRGGSEVFNLTEHWDGTSWTVVPSPNAGTIMNNLNGVAAAAPNDIWAVGNTLVGAGGSDTVVLHWSGSTWSVTPDPVTTADTLDEVAVADANDVWAVGGHASKQHYPLETSYAEGWNGVSWTTMHTPQGPPTGRLFSVAVAGSVDAGWAVGELDRGSAKPRTLIEQWNGRRWSVFPSANVSGAENHVFAVTATGSSYAWAVGDWVDARRRAHTLIEQYC